MHMRRVRLGFTCLARSALSTRLQPGAGEGAQDKNKQKKAAKTSLAKSKNCRRLLAKKLN
jgi:hypothetical protein